MTQEQKQLLLKDICTRLPYMVKGRVYAENTNGEYDINGDMIFFNSSFDVILDRINFSTKELHVVAVGDENTVDFIEDQQTFGEPYIIDEFKPYLRPMSSMTEEEYGEFLNTQNMECGDGNRPKYEYTYKTFDWLNTHHFDYRGLISMGLALEAPEGMYNF